MRLPLEGWRCRVVVECLGGRSSWWRKGPLELWPAAAVLERAELHSVLGLEGLPGLFLFAESGERSSDLPAGKGACSCRGRAACCWAAAERGSRCPAAPTCTGAAKEQWHTALQWATGHWESTTCQQAQQYSLYCQALQALNIVDLNPTPPSPSSQQQQGKGAGGSRLGGARAALRKAGGWFKGFKAGAHAPDHGPKTGPVRQSKAGNDSPEEASTPTMAGAQRMQQPAPAQGQDRQQQQQERERGQAPKPLHSLPSLSMGGVPEQPAQQLRPRPPPLRIPTDQAGAGDAAAGAGSAPQGPLALNLLLARVGYELLRSPKFEGVVSQVGVPPPPFGLLLSGHAAIRACCACCARPAGTATARGQQRCDGM